MRYLLVDEQAAADKCFEDAVRTFDTLEAVRSHVAETNGEYDSVERGWNGQTENETWREGLTLYEIVRVVPVNIETTVSVSFGEADTSAPRPGESAADYLARTRG